MENSFYEDDLDEDYSFLQEISCLVDKKEEITMYDFLHGYCDVFASTLAREYPSYTPMGVYEYGKLIHAYCKTDTGYIDIRGKTDDFDKMMMTFYNDGLYENMDATIIKPLEENKIYKPAEDAALYYIDTYNSYYDENKIEEYDYNR